MDAQGTMRLMFDTMDAYDRADFDRLGEVYAAVRDYPSMEAAQAAMAVDGAGGGVGGG
jgi:hypothetical protein